MLQGGNHTCGDNPFTYSASHKDTVGWNQKSQILTHQTKGHICTGLMSTARVSWLNQASSYYWCSSFFAAIRPWRPDSRSLLWTVDVEMRLLLELCEAFIWAVISERLFILMNLSLYIFQIDWPSCLKVMMDCHLSLLIWAVLAIIWTWYFTK